MGLVVLIHWHTEFTVPAVPAFARLSRRTVGNWTTNVCGRVENKKGNRKTIPPGLSLPPPISTRKRNSKYRWFAFWVGGGGEVS